MQFLMRKIGPLPTWAYIGIVVVGGVVFYIWWRHYTGSSSSSQTPAATNPLNPTNDPNIDPNTGVPYALEEAINPATGQPYYYSNPYGNPTSTTSNPPTSTTSNPPYTPVYTNPPESKHPFDPEPTHHKDPFAASSYTFNKVGTTGQTEHLSNVAMKSYGVQGNSQVNAAVQQIINANPGLRGRTGSYQPPEGTTIVLPKM